VVRALVVGSLVQDLAFRVPTRPQPGEVVVATAFGAFRGGKGYNQAVALARLGAQVTMIGAVGADAYGDGFVAALAREGVDASRVAQVRGASTSVAVPLITPDGDVAFVQHPGANMLVTTAHCADLPDCDVLLLQGEVPAPASLHAARAVRGRGGLVVLNPAPVHEITPELAEIASVIVPNEVEARALLGDTGADVGDVALAQRLQRPGREAVVTLGARGAAWASEVGAGIVPAPAITAVDATSAGDSFCAALALSLAEGASLPEAVRLGCAAGGHAATVAGAEPSLPTRAQAEALLASIPSTV
jgi:ribokinase